MTTLHLSDGIIKDEILVVGLSHKKSSRDGKVNLVIESGDIALDAKKLLPILADMGATGKTDEVVKVPGITTRLLVFTGLGEHKPALEDEVLRRAAGAAARALCGSSSATVSLPTRKISSLEAIAEGVLLGSYVFNKFRVDSMSERNPSLKSVTIHSKQAGIAGAKDAIKRATIIGLYSALTRDLINTPPSHLNPDSFCKEFTNLVKKAGGAAAGLKISVMNESQLKSKGYGGITAVGQGSANPPRLLHISYRPVKAKAKKTYAYVGKVLNPDAEGRLVLGDALVKAQENKDLDGIVDVATLTGAQVVALGTRTAAIMTNNQEFSDHFFALSKAAGEAFWPMPLPVELRASLDSPVADMANIGERMGGMLVAGLFLKEFISPELPWLHLDIAGPAYNEGEPYGYTPVGGTGMALRSLVALAQSAAIS